MPLTHPKSIRLKRSKCPECRGPLAPPRLESVGGTVVAGCRDDSCGYRFELFFLGDAALN
ncbi:MAG: hypothetical protein ABII00_08325 [Elusimicrobiota bacterium]